LAIALVATGADRVVISLVLAQDEVKNFRKPILMVETGGHHARVRSLVWQDSSTLLSGGEDKVVKVWDLQQGQRLARSLRPPIWRGPAGTIYAMSMTRPDGNGQSFLAVGGYGVESRRGDLTIFRVPGAELGAGRSGRIPTGEVVARLLSPRENQPDQIGHRDSVFCLAFDPTGRVLASGSKDTTVILWEVPTFRPRIVLSGRHTRAVLALAFSPDGQRLATAGADGSLRIWNVATGTQIQERPGNVQQPVPINTISFSPDGQSIVVGRENGDLFRFDGNNVGLPPVKLPTRQNQGPVEFVTHSPDGRQLAVSFKSDMADTIDPIAMTSDVEIRALPGGETIRSWRVPGLVLALAYSPEGRRLAYAGGPAQAIFVQDLTNLDSKPQELKGHGSTPFDLGFTLDSRVVGFTREQFGPANLPRTYEGFDLEKRRALRVPGNQLRHALKTLNGWSIEGSIRDFRLEAVHRDGRRWRLDISPETERNWWSYTMIAPGPGHAQPVLAVGCESGIILYNLESQRRTRVFAGHSSPVVALAPSPDGRWLASSSLDQTIQIYPLAGSDIRPDLGATFLQRPGQTWIVTQVKPHGFAEGMGLRAGDRILKAGIALGQQQVTYYDKSTMAEFVARVDDLRPGLDTIALWVSRTGHFPTMGVLDVDLPPLPSTRRNNASMTLMQGVDKEWVVWTPQGFYDTSIEGDSRFLGWHINPDFRLPRPTDFVPIGSYARTMMRPKVLDRLWQTADLDQALKQDEVAAKSPAPAVQAYDQRPPRITFASVEGGIRLPAPGVLWLVRIPNPRLGLNIQAEGSSRILTRKVTFDEQVQELPPLPAPREQISENLPVLLVPNRRVRLAVEAVNEAGNSRVETLDMVYSPPPPFPPAPESRPRMVVLSVGVERTRSEKLLPRIQFADRDAVELAGFMPEHLTSADGARVLHDGSSDQIPLTGDLASTGAIEQALEGLSGRLRNNQLRKGDIVVVVVAAHVLDLGETSMVAASDTTINAKFVPGPVVRTQTISERLGELADYGCRVVLFLDGVHEPAPAGFESKIKPWVRDLHLHRRVVTFVASREGPGEVDVPSQHGVFALGVSRAFRQVVAAGKAQNQPLTLEEFARAVQQMVLDLSGRQQEASCYIPRGVPPQSLFARP